MLYYHHTAATIHTSIQRETKQKQTVITPCVVFLPYSTLQKNYYCTLELHGTNPNVKATFSGEVIPIDDYASIVDAYKCYSIKSKAFKNLFVDENGNYRITISIRNITKEIKRENIIPNFEEEIKKSRMNRRQVLPTVKALILQVLSKLCHCLVDQFELVPIRYRHLKKSIFRQHLFL